MAVSKRKFSKIIDDNNLKELEKKLVREAIAQARAKVAQRKAEAKENLKEFEKLFKEERMKVLADFGEKVLISLGEDLPKTYNEFLTEEIKDRLVEEQTFVNILKDMLVNAKAKLSIDNNVENISVDSVSSNVKFTKEALNDAEEVVEGTLEVSDEEVETTEDDVVELTSDEIYESSEEEELNSIL